MGTRTPQCQCNVGVLKYLILYYYQDDNCNRIRYGQEPAVLWWDCQLDVCPGSRIVYRIIHHWESKIRMSPHHQHPPTHPGSADIVTERCPGWFPVDSWVRAACLPNHYPFYSLIVPHRTFWPWSTCPQPTTTTTHLTTNIHHHPHPRQYLINPFIIISVRLPGPSNKLVTNDKYHKWWRWKNDKCIIKPAIIHCCHKKLIDLMSSCL